MERIPLKIVITLLLLFQLAGSKRSYEYIGGVAWFAGVFAKGGKAWRTVAKHDEV